MIPNSKEIFNEVTCALSAEIIAANAKRNNEMPFGYVIDYLKDMYMIPKTQGWDIAKKICQHFGLWPSKKRYELIIKKGVESFTCTLEVMPAINVYKVPTSFGYTAYFDVQKMRGKIVYNAGHTTGWRKKIIEK
jgi:hypothetical protein